MVGIGLSLYFLVLTSRNEALPEDWRQTITSTLALAGNGAVSAYERGGTHALVPVINEVARRARARLWLFAETGKKLNDLPLPNEFEEEPPPGPPPPQDNGGESQIGRPPAGVSNAAPPDYVPSIVGEALERNTTVFHDNGPTVTCGLAIDSNSGRHYVIMARLPHPLFGRETTSTRTQVLGGLLVFVLSGLVCFWLVRYLTSPLVELRAATQRLAEGDLGARTGAIAHPRRDEVANLGVDFDAMAERIEGLMNAQRQLLGDISHELRSPLARLNMALALSRRTAEGINATEIMEPALERISRETKRLDALIAQLLTLTRLESGEKSDYRLFDLAQLIREIVDDTDFEARASGRTVRLLQTAPFSLVGSRDLWHSAIENVIRNAVRHTDDLTSVDVRLVTVPELTVRVRDHGPGVPPEALEHLFKPFFRVEKARDRNTGGVGLGLAITYRAIRSHGGSVEARNHPEGGLEVRLCVPLEAIAQQSEA